VRSGVLALLSILVAANVVAFERMPDGNKPVDILVDTMYGDMKLRDAGYRGLCAFPFEYADAYRAVKASNRTGQTYSVGWVYGILPEIMNGYSTEAIGRVNDISKAQADLGGDDTAPAQRADGVDRDARIEVVLLGATTHKGPLLQELLTRGWSVAGEYRNARYGSTVVVAQRGARR